MSVTRHAFSCRCHNSLHLTFYPIKLKPKVQLIVFFSNTFAVVVTVIWNLKYIYFHISVKQHFVHLSETTQNPIDFQRVSYLALCLQSVAKKLGFAFLLKQIFFYCLSLCLKRSKLGGLRGRVSWLRESNGALCDITMGSCQELCVTTNLSEKWSKQGWTSHFSLGFTDRTETHYYWKGHLTLL